MYNYYDAMKNDLIDAVYDEVNFDKMIAFDQPFNNEDDLFQILDETLWVDDSVTGNGSGSYTFNSALAKEYVLDNFDLLKCAADEWGVDDFAIRLLNEEWEWLDVSIRCYILGQVICEFIEKNWKGVA